jgi:hypothetical protein
LNLLREKKIDVVSCGNWKPRILRIGKNERSVAVALREKNE